LINIKNGYFKKDFKLTNISTKQDLVDYFNTGSKSKNNVRIGTEHEKFLFDLKNKIPFLMMAILVL